MIPLCVSAHLCLPVPVSGSTSCWPRPGRSWTLLSVTASRCVRAVCLCVCRAVCLDGVRPQGEGLFVLSNMRHVQQDAEAKHSWLAGVLTFSAGAHAHETAQPFCMRLNETTERTSRDFSADVMLHVS